MGVFKKTEKGISYEREIKGEILNKLEPGVYKLGDVGNMFSGAIPYFSYIENKDKLIKFEKGVMKEFLDSTKEFFSEKTINAYKELEIIHKIGYIFYGKPGSGKTSLCFLAMQELVKNSNAICIDCTDMKLNFVQFVIKSIRAHQNNPICIFYDEFDFSIRHHEESFLPFLDGNDSVEDLIFIGCTNYINKIPDRIKNRKSRIKECFSIDALPIEIYEEYLKNKLSKHKNEEIYKFAFLAEEAKLTIDQLKNALIDFKIIGLSIENSIAEALKIPVEECENND